MWRGGRVAEGARLESVYTGNRIAGSNPAPSATNIHLEFAAKENCPQSPVQLLLGVSGKTV